MDVFKTADVRSGIITYSDLEGGSVNIVHIVQFVASGADPDPLIGIN
jgi:hypothetical protein